MTRKIFKSILTASLIVFAVAYLAVIAVLYNYFTTVKENDLKTLTYYVASGIESEGITYLTNLDTGDSNTRVTWIDADGTVLYDSVKQADTMENHLDRQEVQDAISDGYGEAKRYSSTIMERSLYSAKRLSDGTIIRLSTTQRSVFMLITGMVQPVLIIVVIAIILSIVLAKRLAARVVRPLNALNLDSPLENEDLDELAPLFKRLQTQQLQIKDREYELSQRKNELDVILANMREGILLLGDSDRIVTINPAACSILHTDMDAIGRDLLTVNRSLELHSILERAHSGSAVEENVTFDGNIYRVSASPVLEGTKVRGIALLMSDVTDKVNTEKLRREFTTNVSHELKTPLHSISGYAELLKDNMVAVPDMPSFASKIYDEAKHMIDLVNDIIKLSHLDEGATGLAWENVDLSELVSSAAESFREQADKAGVTINVECENNVQVYAVPQLASEIVRNLIDNAIKYNITDGKVDVTLKREQASGGIVFSVSDTGIGIPVSEQERIFERFYRVDKSHTNSQVNGTGLGLSIVKHACSIMHCTINVVSNVGSSGSNASGTNITIVFPC